MGRPFFIWIFSIWGLGGSILIIPVVCLALVVEGLDTSIFGEIQGVGDSAWGKIAFIIGFWVFTAIVGFGFWNRISWSRHFVVATLSSLYLIELFQNFDFGSLVIVVVFMSLVLWYFYKKPNVVEYFNGT